MQSLPKHRTIMQQNQLHCTVWKFDFYKITSVENAQTKERSQLTGISTAQASPPSLTLIWMPILVQTLINICFFEMVRPTIT